MRRYLMPMAALMAGIALPTVASAQDAITTADLNMRAGPSPSFPVVDVIPESAPVDIHGCVAGYSWCDVTAGGARGWVYANYLSHDAGGSYVPLIEYAPESDLPIVSFSVGTYWDNYYRDRPWYSERYTWGDRWRDDWRGIRRDIRDRRFERRRDRLDDRVERREERREAIRDRRREARMDRRDDRADRIRERRVNRIERREPLRDTRSPRRDMREMRRDRGSDARMERRRERSSMRDRSSRSNAMDRPQRTERGSTRRGRES